MNALSKSESQELVELEAVIRDNSEAFVKAGKALALIRDKKLFRSTHETFEDYCQSTWKFSRQNASLLIRAAAVHGNLSSAIDSPKPTSVRQAVELSKLPTEEQSEAWREVLDETDNEPTAVAVKEVVERKQSKAAGVERDREAAKSFHQRGGDDFDDEPAEAETIHSYYSEFLELWSRADEPARAMIRIFVEEQ